VVPLLTRALSGYPPDGNDVKTGESRLLAIFTGLNVLALILIFFLVPETAGATLGSDDAQGLNYISLEELNYIFSVKTTEHIRYQIAVMVPWAWNMVRWKYRRLVRQRNEGKPEHPYQLYVWVQAEHVNAFGQEITNQRGSSDGA
jgi:hypothetical protein